MRPKHQLSTEDKENIAEWVSQGVTVINCAKRLGIGPYIITRSIAEDPQFEKMVAEARVAYLHLQVEGLINITEGCENITDVHAARLKSDNIKWVASKLVPKTYGDNLNLNVSHHLDLSSVLLAAENRVLPLLLAPQVELPKANEIAEVNEIQLSAQQVAEDVEIINEALQSSENIDEYL